MPPITSLETNTNTNNNNNNNNNHDANMLRMIRPSSSTNDKNHHHKHQHQHQQHPSIGKKNHPHHHANNNTELKKQFTEFHNSKEFGKDTSSPYLGDESSVHRNNLFAMYGNHLMQQHQHTHQHTHDNNTITINPLNDGSYSHRKCANTPVIIAIIDIIDIIIYH